MMEALSLVLKKNRQNLLQNVVKLRNEVKVKIVYTN